MKKLIFPRFFILLGITIALSSCGQSPNQTNPSQLPQVETAMPSPSSGKAQLEVWASNNGIIGIEQDFEIEYPKIDINLKVIDSLEKYNSECLVALSSGTGPDVFFFDSSFFGQYTANGVLENLLEEPYLAGKYEKDFPEDVWESNKSIDGKSLLAMTFLSSPYVTYYRYDVMKENGFPCEPEEFGKFIEKPENILDIAKKLKPKGQYIFQWPTDLPNLLGASVGLFDKNLNYTRGTDEFVKILDVAKEAHKSGYELEVSFWEEPGRKAVENNKLVMLYNLGSWGSGSIQNYAPEQSGKWRATKPALGVYAWQADTKVAINSESKNKENAWKFLEFTALQKGGGVNYDMINGYKPSRRNEKAMLKINDYLGGQETQPLFEDVADNMKQYKLTPIDAEALVIFEKDISDATVRNIDSKLAIKNLKEKLEDMFDKEVKSLMGN